MRPSQTCSDERKWLSQICIFIVPSKWKWVKVTQLCPTLCNSMDSPWNSPGQSTGRGSLFPFPGDLTNTGIEPGFPALQVDSLPAELQGKHCPFKACANSSIFPSFINLRHILPCPWVRYPNTPSFKNISNIIFRLFSSKNSNHLFMLFVLCCEWQFITAIWILLMTAEEVYILGNGPLFILFSFPSWLLMWKIKKLLPGKSLRIMFSYKRIKF